MIQANELRLNNWVYSIEIGDNVQISAISEDGFSFKNCVTWDYPSVEEISPIPITQEILLKCGFEKLQITNCRTEEVFKVGKRYLYFNKFEKVWYLNYDDHVPYCNNIQPIKYLHELQNTYYFTSKDGIYEDIEELEINL